MKEKSFRLATEDEPGPSETYKKFQTGASYVKITTLKKIQISKYNLKTDLFCIAKRDSTSTHLSFCNLFTSWRYHSQWVNSENMPFQRKLAVGALNKKKVGQVYYKKKNVEGRYYLMMEKSVSVFQGIEHWTNRNDGDVGENVGQIERHPVSYINCKL